MKDLHELSIKIYGHNWFLTILPFSWYLWFNKSKYDRGDINDHVVQFLCVEFQWRWISKKGIEGKKYRKELKRQKAEQEKNAYMVGHGILD